jgi:hypothetical protein
LLLDLFVEVLFFGHLLFEGCGEGGDFCFKRDAVVDLVGDAYVAAGGEDEVVLADFFEGGGLAETLGILVCTLAFAPFVVGLRESGDILFLKPNYMYNNP